MNKAFVLIFCGLSLFLWEVRDVRSQVLPSDQEILKRQALSRLQDREWLSTLRMTLWPSAYPEEPIYYGETNVTHQSGRTWYHLEAGGVWQQLPVPRGGDIKAQEGARTEAKGENGFKVLNKQNDPAHVFVLRGSP